MLEFSYQRTLEASDMFNQAFSATHDPHLLIGPLRHGALRRLRRHPTSITASSKGVVVTGGNRGFGCPPDNIDQLPHPWLTHSRPEQVICLHVPAAVIELSHAVTGTQ